MQRVIRVDMQYLFKIMCIVQCYVGQLNRQVLMGPPIIALTYQIQNSWSKSQIGNHSKGYILYVTGHCFMTVQAVSISEVGLAFARSPRAYLLRYFLNAAFMHTGEQKGTFFSSAICCKTEYFPGLIRTLGNNYK